MGWGRVWIWVGRSRAHFATHPRLVVRQRLGHLPLSRAPLCPGWWLLARRLSLWCPEGAGCGVRLSAGSLPGEPCDRLARAPMIRYLALPGPPHVSPALLWQHACTTTAWPRPRGVWWRGHWAPGDGSGPAPKVPACPPHIAGCVLEPHAGYVNSADSHTLSPFTHPLCVHRAAGP